jgi:MFS family permease
LFFAGYCASQLGTAMSAVAIAFAVLDEGGTPTGLGVVFAANIVPMIVFLLGGGVLADRLGRRPVMLAADVTRSLAQGGLACALFLGHPGVGVFAVAAFLVGVGNAFFGPALSGLTVQIADRERLRDANALLGMAQPAARMAGPALAGILIAVTSPAVVIAADAVSYGASALVLASLRVSGSRDGSSAGPAQGRQRQSLRRDLAEGWAAFTARTWLMAETLQFTLFNLLTWGPYLVLGPVLARSYLGGARAWGVILACYGGGAILGGLLAMGHRPARPLLVGTLTTLGFPLPPLALALHLPLAFVAAGALIAGTVTAFGGAIETTVTQVLVPSEVLARVQSFGMVGAFGLGPLAFIAAGPVSSVVGARAVLGFGAAWAVLGTLAVLLVPAVWRVRWDGEVASPGRRVDGAGQGMPARLRQGHRGPGRVADGEHGQHAAGDAQRGRDEAGGVEPG